MTSFEQPPKEPSKEEEKPISPEEELFKRRLDEEIKHREETKKMADDFASAQKELFKKVFKTLGTIGDAAERKGHSGDGGEAAKTLEALKDDFEEGQRKLEETLRQSREAGDRRMKEIENKWKQAKTQIKTPEEILMDTLKSIPPEKAFEVYWLTMRPKIVHGTEKFEWLSDDLRKRIQDLHKEARSAPDLKEYEERLNKLKEEAFNSWRANKEKK